MRLFSYIFLAYFALALQIGLAPYIAYHGATPNLVLLAVVFIAVHAPRDAALVGCFALGFLQDLVTLQQPGLYAFSYGLVAMFVVSTQQVVYKEHPLTHFSLALAAGLMTAIVLLAHGWIWPITPRRVEAGVVLPAVRMSTTRELYRVLYTALLAPFLLGLLQRARTLFGFQGRRRVRAW